MNKFLKKRAGEASSPSDELPASPIIKKPSSSRWKKNPKRMPEPQAPQLDLSIALPPSDDFRTSLIMPSLSTRFSMLRELDDPRSLIGKASDDSVLTSGRKSRMMEFGLGLPGLSDIAEVSSTHGSIRPPFAADGRQHSTASDDGYGSDADAQIGNMMTRSRPGEGNTLFGGRQKVYRIPTDGASSTKSPGKLYYEDDVGKSAFQKYRHQRDANESHISRPSNDSQGFDFGLDKAVPENQDDDEHPTLPNDSAKDLSHSPSSSYNKDRSTMSSDARSIARSSTAATSIASQSAVSSTSSPACAHPPLSAIGPVGAAAPLPDRTHAKPRRLYEQGLDQHLQDQQNSAITRLNSIQRQRATGGKNGSPFLHGTRSAGNLHERSNSPAFAFQAPSLTMNSPTLPRLNTFGSLKHATPASTSPICSVPHSPVDGPHDEPSALAQALEPGDRGKATALGAFNKPAHAFDEQQYLERQKQLQRTTSSAAVKSRAMQQNVSRRIDIFEQERQVRQPSTSPEPAARSRSASVSKKHEPTKAYNVFQNAVNQFPTKVSAAPAKKAPLPDTHRTFFGNISASEDEDEEEDAQIAQSFNQPEYGYGGYYGKWQPTVLPSVSEHPALRNQRSAASLAEEAEEEGRSTLKRTTSNASLRIDAKGAAEIAKALDSPTLPETQTFSGMNGVVHHLRQRSNQSSVYPTDDMKAEDEDVPEVPEVPGNPDAHRHVPNSSLRTQASIRDLQNTASNPWDLDEARSILGARHASQSDNSPIDQGVEKPQRHLEASGSSPFQDDASSWQQELRKQHTREVSTATLQERDAFSRELAARREAVKENLKSVVETNHSRANSPVLGNSGTLRAFEMLRAKPSRESLANVRDQPTKALKAPSIKGNAPSMNKSAQSDRSVYSVELTRPRGNSSPRPSMPPNVQHPAFKNDRQEDPRESDSLEYVRERQLASARSTAMSSSRTRSRSNSTTTNGRSRSRNGQPYRDDLQKAMVEGHGSMANAHEPTPEASPGPMASERDSHGSKVGIQAYFDQRNGTSSQNSNTRLASSGVTPASTSPNVYNPGRPAPVANPFSQNPTPPLSESRVLPSPGTFSPMFTPPISSGPPRKRTITKSDISVPVQLLSSTSNVDTVDLPEGASLRNGMEDAPPIPPINPLRRGTRRLFGFGSKEGHEKEQVPLTSQSDPHLFMQTSSPRSEGFPSSNAARLPPWKESMEKQPALQQYGYSPTEPQERERRMPTRTVTAPIEGGMF